MARVWKLYDNPDARKLQRKPVPVMGGVAVYLGIFAGTAILLTISYNKALTLMLVAMTILLVVGVIDDRRNLPAGLRFLMEIGIMAVLTYANGNMIDNLHGLWGVYELPQWLAYTLSIITGVGLINAINLIDGVDGYASGFAVMAFLLFGIIYYMARIPGMAIVCMIVMGSVMPFFLHNVFGKKTKMFIGDGGTLMLGTLITAFVFSILKGDSLCARLETNGFGLIPFCLAVLSVPVFDTLRVMFSRILKGYSPFKPDKNHLHHLFIDLGFSHIGTTTVILLTNLMVVAAQVIAWACGANMEVQLYIVVALGLLITVVFYGFMKVQRKRNTLFFRGMLRLGRRSHIETSGFWTWMRKLVDDELFSEGREEWVEDEEPKP
jgi:UDP-N-acetylmuramyl pentapeptide phosphotransferase/UDP-N-acetylglucosamine-1-phosphate transferase